MSPIIAHFVWNISAGVLGLAAIGAIFYLKRRTSAKLVYQWNGRVVVGKEKGELPEDITIALEESGCPYISTTEIVFWNAGRHAIRGSDIDAADPLRMSSPFGSRILSILTRAVSNEAISFTTKQDPDHPNTIFCGFDQLGPGDGVRLQIYETGVSHGISVGGTVRGLPNGILNWGAAPLGNVASKTTSWMARFSPYMFLFSSTFFIIMIPLRIARHYDDSFGNWSWTISLVLWSWMYFRMGIAQLRARFGRYPRRLADH